MGVVAVVGNLAIDRVDRGPPRPGGCPVFAAQALRALGADGVILTRCAAADRALFVSFLAEAGVPVSVLEAEATAAFRIELEGEERAMTIDAVGDVWTPDDVAAVPAVATHVHVAPLSRSEFPAGTLRALAAGGRFVSLDGQGLVRASVRGPLLQDAGFDRAVLAPLAALKLSEEEAGVVAGGRFHRGTAEVLGVPEILVTLGSRGAVVYAGGRETGVPVEHPVTGVETTGAGDLFMVAYCVARARAAEPVEAAGESAALVRAVLAERASG
jgi:sugar/nucleoside kinase (ribokinase family)